MMSRYGAHQQGLAKTWASPTEPPRTSGGGLSKQGFSRLSRPIQPMPATVRAALIGRDLLAAYEARPPYQQNDTLAWIVRAKRPETQQRRLAQMLDDLARGNLYIKMPQGP